MQQEIFRLSADLIYVSQATVSVVVKSISVLLAEQLGHFVKFSGNEQNQRSNILTIYNIGKFPSVIGCADCTHIPIGNPGQEHGEVFRNRVFFFKYSGCSRTTLGNHGYRCKTSWIYTR